MAKRMNGLGTGAQREQDQFISLSVRDFKGGIETCGEFVSRRNHRNTDYRFLELERIFRDHLRKFYLTDEKTELKMI